MGLLSFFKRLPFKRTPEPAKPAKAAKAAQIVPPESPDSVQQARLRARQRLIGSVVLVVAGVIGFSLLFETQPRPLPVDTPIEIARRDGSTPAPSVSSAPARSGNKPATGGSTGGASNTPETQADAGREVASAPAAPAVVAAVTPAVPAPPKPEAKPVEPKPAAKPEAKPEPKPEPKSEAKPEAKPTPKPADGARAQALLEGKDSAKKPAAAEGRFIVQVGAFADQAAAREARQKVEKLGLKTYTQMVETSGGNRIRVRVGPFSTRDEADKAAGKIKSAGLPSAVYTL